MYIYIFEKKEAMHLLLENVNTQCVYKFKGFRDALPPLNL